MTTGATGDGDTSHAELSGTARDVVQARHVHGGVHFHGAPADPEPTPRQLPADVSGFVNRHQQLTYLRQAAIDGSGEPTVGVIIVIAGTAGVGKTSLAVRHAHQVRDRFPDGQLYVNLRGYDPGPPVEAAEALERFLRALGIRSGGIPHSLEGRAELYRSLVAERRFLIVLDNAADARAVRPLLPGTPTCLVIVTSRSRLSALVAREGARRLTVDVLAEDEAVELLRLTMRDYRSGDSEADLRELSRLCARLPLALRIAAERASSRPHTPLSELIADLRDESALWDLLTAEEDQEAGAVRTVFAWSYRALPPDAARLFRLLGLHPGPDFSTAAASALAGIAPNRARQLLDVLVGAHLLGQEERNRYRFHDLLRAYAADQVHAEEDPELPFARLTAWYLHTAEAAVAASDYDHRGFTLPAPPDGVRPLVFDNHDSAIAWYERERDNLVACVQAADRARRDEVTMLMPAVLYGMYNSRHPFDEWVTTTTLGLEAARRAGNTAVEAYLLHSLGKAYTQSQRYAQGLAAHLAALALRRAAADRPGEIDSLSSAALANKRLRHLDDALDQARAALALAAGIADPDREQFAMHILGWVLTDLEEYEEAARWVEASVSLARELHNTTAEVDVLVPAVQLRLGRGDLAEALAVSETALVMARELDDRVLTAQHLIDRGCVLTARGEPEEALIAFHEATLLQRQLGNRGREAEAVDGSGLAHQAAGRPAQAVPFHRSAAIVHRQLGDRWLLAVATANLARALTEAGTAAAEPAREALDLLADFPDPAARRLRAQLVVILSSEA